MISDMKVKCIRPTTEGDNTDRSSGFGIRVGGWYDVLDQKIVDVGNPDFTNPLKYKISVLDYINSNGDPIMRGRWFSAYLFITQRELNLEELGIC